MLRGPLQVLDRGLSGQHLPEHLEGEGRHLPGLFHATHHSLPGSVALHREQRPVGIGRGPRASTNAADDPLAGLLGFRGERDAERLSTPQYLDLDGPARPRLHVLDPAVPGVNRDAVRLEHHITGLESALLGRFARDQVADDGWEGRAVLPDAEPFEEVASVQIVDAERAKK